MPASSQPAGPGKERMLYSHSTVLGPCHSFQNNCSNAFKIPVFILDSLFPSQAFHVFLICLLCLDTEVEPVAEKKQKKKKMKSKGGSD